MITEKGCSSLALALNSNPDHLRDLDLSYNHPGDSEMKLRTAKQQDPDFKLEYVLLACYSCVKRKMSYYLQHVDAKIGKP